MEGVSFGRHMKECVYVMLAGKHLLTKKQVIEPLMGKINHCYCIKLGALV